VEDSLRIFLFQLAVIFVAAKIGGEICERFLKQPAVLGELAMGMAVGPHALGRLAIPGMGPLFPFVAGPAGQAASSQISPELYLISQLAVIILLFSAGLGTDFRQFFRFAGPAALVAVGGLVTSFVLGATAAVMFGLAKSFLAPQALFVGAILGATSTGVTARILRDIGRLGTPEGVTTMAADVIDDVLGILVLTVVLGLTAGGFQASETVFNVGKALAFWLALSAVGIVTAKYVARFIVSFKVVGAALSLSLALAFFTGGLAEAFGLATVIGAYSIGLAIGNTELAGILAKPIDTIHHLLVPVFFVVMGMMVDFTSMGGVVMFGLAISLLAILGKLVGCGIPSLSIGFNRRGALRIGFGMVPRGEVNLIVAGVGLTRGIISSNIFGIAVIVIMVTIVFSPIVLSALYRGEEEGTREQAS
jgi:Kef-type K+ transport system membrane component KefB